MKILTNFGRLIRKIVKHLDREGLMCLNMFEECELEVLYLETSGMSERKS